MYEGSCPFSLTLPPSRAPPLHPISTGPRAWYRGYPSPLRMLCLGTFHLTPAEEQSIFAAQACFITRYVSPTTRDLTSTSLAWKCSSFLAHFRRECAIWVYEDPCGRSAVSTILRSFDGKSLVRIKMLRPDVYAAFVLPSVISLTSSTYSMCEWASACVIFSAGRLLAFLPVKL